jgi:hypothetical protein
MNIKLELYYDTELWEVVSSVNACLQASGVDIQFVDISEEEDVDDCMVYGLIVDGKDLYEIGED